MRAGDLRKQVLDDLVRTGVGGTDRPRPLARDREPRTRKLPLIRREKRA